MPPEPPTARTTPVDPKDMFCGGLYWVRNVPGLGLRSALPGECAAEIQRLRAGIQAMLDGNYPHPRSYRPGNCPHGHLYYEECVACNAAWLTALLDGTEKEMT